MACSSADCVFGLARLISSAIRSWAKIGPLTKRKLRRPPALSSSTSEPMMSEGMRSGVNWMRLASSPRILPKVSTSSVLARPGTPISRAWPPHKRVISVCSMTWSWPKMTADAARCTRWMRSPAVSTRLAMASSVWVSVLMILNYIRSAAWIAKVTWQR